MVFLCGKGYYLCALFFWRVAVRGVVDIQWVYDAKSSAYVKKLQFMQRFLWMSQFGPSTIASTSSAENLTFVLAMIIAILQIPDILSWGNGRFINPSY